VIDKQFMYEFCTCCYITTQISCRYNSNPSEIPSTMEHRNRTNNTTGWSWSASKITERPSCSFGKPIVKVVVLLSLALFSFLGSALGGSTEEMGNRKRSSIISHRNNNKRILPQGSCITTGTIKDDVSKQAKHCMRKREHYSFFYKIKERLI
jgi:hypothetical protein